MKSWQRNFFVIAYHNWFEVSVEALQLKAVTSLDKFYPGNSKCFSVISRSIQILVVKQNIKYHGETFGIRKKRQRTSTGKKYILYSNSTEIPIISYGSRLACKIKDSREIVYNCHEKPLQNIDVFGEFIPILVP